MPGSIPSENSTSIPFREIASLTPDAAYVHRDGDILWCNAAAETMFRATAEKPLVGSCAWQLIAPRDRDRVIAEYRHLGPAESPTDLRVVRCRLDGSVFPTEARGATITWEGAPATLMLIRDLSGASEHEATLAESTIRELDFAEISPDTMLIHVQGAIVYANQAACAMFRAGSARDIVGRDVRDLVHPEYHQYIRKNWIAALNGLDDELVQVRRVRLDGTTFIGEGRHRIVPWKGQSALLVVIRDATPRLEAEQALRQREAQYKGLLDDLPDAVLTHVDGEIVYANRVAAAMFHADSPDALIGMTMRDITHPDDRAALTRSWMASYQKPDPTAVITRNRLRLDGTTFISESRRISNVWQSTQGIVLVLRDVTERKRDEERIVAAQQEAERANEAKSQFFANMSHELRTPLNSILGFSEVIEGEMFGAIGHEKYADYAGSIHKSGKHLLSLIDDMLDLSKAESGKYELHETEFDMTALVGDILHMMSPQVASRSIDVEYNPAIATCMIRAGERQIRQIVTNVMSNAVKFTPENGRIVIDLETPPNGSIVIRVADTGIGIASTDLPKLFQVYSQVRNSMTANAHGGTGLGLALTKKLVDLHGGQIGIESVEGEGTTVTIALPAAGIRGTRAKLAASRAA